MARGPDVDPVGRQEGERHRPADQDGVGEVGEAVDDADLVGHLDAPDDHHERVLRRVQQPVEGVQLRGHQQPGGRRQQVRHALGRCVRSVGGAERVVDVEVGEGGQIGGHRRVVLLLAGVEAEVLEQPQVALGVAEGHGTAQQLGHPVGHRAERQRRVGLSLGPAEVRSGDHRGATIEQQLDGGQRRPDPRVVGDPAVLQRDVEVGSHEDAPAGHVQVVDAPHAILLIRSTTRQE